MFRMGYVLHKWLLQLLYVDINVAVLDIINVLSSLNSK